MNENSGMMSENLRAKIKKLFDMAEMGTGNEAEVAFQKAQELMAANGITQDDVNLFVIDIPAPKRKLRYLTMLVNMCGAFSGVCSLFAGKKYIFAGDEIGVNIALELFTYLKNEIERQLKKANLKGQKLKNSFRVGCVLGIQAKLERQGGWRDMQEKRKRLMLTHFQKAQKYRSGKIFVDGGAFSTGQQDGADININRQAGVVSRAGLIGG